MQSSGKLILHQPIPNMVTYGKRSFAYGGPTLWNNLDLKLHKIVYYKNGVDILFEYKKGVPLKHVCIVHYKKRVYLKKVKPKL